MWYQTASGVVGSGKPMPIGTSLSLGPSGARLTGWVVDAPPSGPDRNEPKASDDHEKAPGPPTVTDGRIRSPPPEATGAPYVEPPSPDEKTTVLPLNCSSVAAVSTSIRTCEPSPGSSSSAAGT